MKVTEKVRNSSSSIYAQYFTRFLFVKKVSSDIYKWKKKHILDLTINKNIAVLKNFYMNNFVIKITNFNNIQQENWYLGYMHVQEDAVKTGQNISLRVLLRYF